jgi:thiosulfate/3-mercaptopyruvate sulfurtransferase
VGIDPQQEIVTVCTTGVRSAFVATVLASRGVPHVRNYDGSMMEWASDPGAPLVR